MGRENGLNADYKKQSNFSMSNMFRKKHMSVSMYLDHVTFLSRNGVLAWLEICHVLPSKSQNSKFLNWKINKRN
jgi:hypothetical protein